VNHTNARPPVFTPDNEPYLGRALLFHFDQLIASSLEQNARTAPRTHEMTLTPAQRMACQLIPQAVSLALSIRELIRQGYLFGAHVLVRPLAERAIMLLYLNLYPDNVSIWERGWLHNEAPSLGRMIEAIQQHGGGELRWRGHDVTSPMNSLLHGRPDSAPSSLTALDGTAGFAPSKLLDRPDLCDDICAVAIPWLATIQGMMNAYFPPPQEAV
jgi:hypothetical protein